MTNNIHIIKEKLFQSYYKSLNAKQQEAIFAPDGPVLVIAGAGSGKTTVLVNRISYLIHYGNAYSAKTDIDAAPEELLMLAHIASDPVGYDKSVLRPILSRFAHDPCPPDRIMAITFTNKAANEIKERLKREIGDAAASIWAGTFHSICVRLLRRFSSYTEYGSDFIIYDQDDCKKIISNLLKEKEIEDPELTPKYILNVISRAKNEMRSPEQFEKANQGSEKRKLLAFFYTEYQKTLNKSNAMDFDDIIGKTVQLLQENSEVLSWCQKKFRYILVDEYQDTNHAQYLLMKIIGDEHKNVMVVGDDDQSIYKFRGAAVENILNFDKVFPNTKVILLEQNYRSTKNIISAANSLIAHNRSRRGKTLWSAGEYGRNVAVRQLEDQEKEALFIAETIAEIAQKDKRNFRDFAVLYRTKAQSNILETVFTKSALPHRLLSGLRFYDHAEVKDILAYLRFVHNKNDFISLSRIINVPKRGIGQTTVEKIKFISDSTGENLYSVLSNSDQYDELKRSSAKIQQFVDLMNMLTCYSEEHFPSELLHKIIDASSYMETLLGDENEERRKNVDELISSARLYEERSDHPSLTGFLEEIALVSDVDNYDENSNSVTLMTVHAAKGLEFPIVFLVGMEENIFPSPRSCATEEDLEEERRLAYVAMTRAKDELFITHCHHRMLYGRTSANDMSRFIRELPAKFVDIQELRPNIRSEFDYYKKEAPTFQSKIYSVPPIDQLFAPRPPQRSTSSPSPSSKSVTTVEKFAPGDRIVHGIFGAGSILEAKSYGSDTLYVIRFDNGSEKKLMATYAKLKRES